MIFNKRGCRGCNCLATGIRNKVKVTKFRDWEVKDMRSITLFVVFFGFILLFGMVIGANAQESADLVSLSGERTDRNNDIESADPSDGLRADRDEETEDDPYPPRGGLTPELIDTQSARGFLPNHNQLSGSIDNIDISGGKLNLAIPLGSLPRGPGGIGFTLNLQYESNKYDLIPHEENVCNPNYTYQDECEIYQWAELAYGDGGGWSYNSRPYRITEEVKTVYNWDENSYDGDWYYHSSGYCNEGMNYYRYRVILSDGSAHILHLGGDESREEPTGSGYYPVDMSGVTDQCYSAKYSFKEYGYIVPNVLGRTGWQRYYTDDGSYLKYEAWASGTPPYTARPVNDGADKLYFPDGRIALWESSNIMREYDANGNYIEFCYGGPQCPGVTEISSNLSLQAITIIENVGNNGSWYRDKVIVPGPNGSGSSYYIDWEYNIYQYPIEYPIGYDSGTVPWFHDVDPFKQFAIGAGGVRFIHLPTAGVPGALGTVPLAGKGYEFRYEVDCNTPGLSYYGTGSCVYGFGGSYSDGLGSLTYMRTPSEAEYRYSWNVSDGSGPVYGQASSFVHGAKVSKKKVTDTVAGETLEWSFENDVTQTVITNPDGGETTYYYVYKLGAFWSDNLLNRVEERDAAGNLLRERRRVWLQNPAHAMTNGLGFAWSSTPNNPYIHIESEIVYNAAGGSPKSAVTEYYRDSNGRLVLKTEYAWVTGIVSSLIDMQNMNLTALRNTYYDYYVPVTSGYHVNAWWNAHNTSLSGVTARGSRRLDAVQRVTVYDGSNNAKSATEYVYDDPYTKGNVTYERRWDSVKAAPPVPALGYLTSSNSQEYGYLYDSYGNVTDIYEPSVGVAGKPRTHITYDATNSHVIQVETGYNTNEKRTIQYEWYNNGAALWKKTDSDNSVMTEYLYDDAGRVLEVKEISGGSANLRGSWTYYDDVNRTVTVKSDLKTYGDELLQTRTHYDKLGRVSLVQQSDGSALISATDGIKVKTTYSYPLGGRMAITSTPHRLTGDLTLEWSCTQYDTLGRIELVSTFKGSAEPASCEPPNPLNSNTNFTGVTKMAYNAEYTTITDPEGNERQQKVDVLGRLIEVIEDPNGLNYITTYAYDALDNLTEVTQGGQTRTFTYSSLSRLMSAVNPESGTTSYTYHDSGDLWTKTDARLVTSTLTYDALHRVITKSYSDSTPAVTYEYHQLSNGSSAPNIGQLKSVSSSVGTTSYGYNALGQVTSSSQAITGYGTKLFSYDWYLNGALKKQTYPSGKVINYSVDNAGRTNKVYSSSANYVDMTAVGITEPYTADGRIAEMKLGNGLFETRDYRTPGTPTVYKLGQSPQSGNLTQIEYDFKPQMNNGNVQAQRIVRNSTIWSQSYGYDGVNRLTSAIEAGGWSRTYGYDRYGNRYVTALNSAPLEPTQANDFNALNNRLTMAGTGYDAAGNQTSFDGMTFEYDAEGRNTIVKENGTPYVTFDYDGEGRRVKKTSGGVNTYYIYNALGQLAAEYDNNPTPATGTTYLFTDMLGSVRTITNASGTVTECYDYLPFGRILSASDNGRNAAGLNNCFPATPDTNLTSVVDEKFTGQKRDETGLDYFGARYFSAPLGRFTSPDPVVITPARLFDPQQLNAYAYTRNNPLRFIDPTGKIIQLSGDTSAGMNLLCDIVGSSYCKYLELDNDNIVKFNVTEENAQRDTGAFLVYQMVNSLFKYDIFIGQKVPTAETKENGKPLYDLKVNGQWYANLPPFKSQLEKNFGNPKHPRLFPANGIDAQIAFNHEGFIFAKKNSMLPPSLWMVAFHEMAEAYEKIDGRIGDYKTGHDNAVTRELKLRNERPYLRDYNLGSGDVIGAPGTAGFGIILK